MQHEGHPKVVCNMKATSRPLKDCQGKAKPAKPTGATAGATPAGGAPTFKEDTFRLDYVQAPSCWITFRHHAC